MGLERSVKLGILRGIEDRISGQSIFEFNRLYNQRKSEYCLLNSKDSMFNSEAIIASDRSSLL